LQWVNDAKMASRKIMGNMEFPLSA
jgi:hypothetical protein